MGMLAWVMMAIALWHFTIFLPDRFWSGIVGAFLGALVGGVLSGLLISGLSVPGNDDISILTALYAVPGAVAGVAFVYWIGVRQEDAAGEAAYRT
jgi:predicted lipid-binding transport protein (Tim44 family)